MPPKKANTKAKVTPAKAAAAAEPPATITNAKGKEIEATAAAGRSRRASITETLVAKKAATTKSAAKTAPSTPGTKKRGRPAKAADDVEAEAEPPAKRGRKSNAAAEAKPVAKSAPAKKAGRPSTKTAPAPAADAEEPVEPTPKKRGRPVKGGSVVRPSLPAKEAPAKKSRGRPAKSAPAVGPEETAAPKKRGRPPKGGETTKIAEDDPAAAEQLEEELVDAVEDDVAGEPTPAKKRGRPAKGKGKKAAVVEAVGEDVNEEVEEDAVVDSGKQYWLMKAEQEGHDETLKDGSTFNTKFTIDDLREKGGPEPWDGVRNPTACRNMRAMKVGDLALFYASGGKQPGITGIMEVVKEHEADPTAFDENSAYYVVDANKRGTMDKPRWSIVHVEFRKKLSKPVMRKELQKYIQGDGVLAKMQEFTAARLSVSKVSEREWNFINKELIEGFDDDDGALPTASAAVNGDAMEVDDAPNGAAIIETKETIDTAMTTTDTMLPAETTASSRPGSRAGSRVPSRAGSRAPSQDPKIEKKSSRPASRAGSLAPPTTASGRGRSRTPGARAGSAKPFATVVEEQETIPE